jgi:hypothetical protein
VRETEELAVCVDCLGWSQYGPTDPYWEYSEGYSGPVEPLLSAVWADVSGTEPHYSRYQCWGCGSGLAGDRYTLTVGLREESVL